MEHKHSFDTIYDSGSLLCGDCLINKRGAFRKEEKHAGGRPCEYCAKAVEIEVKTNKYLNDCRGKNGTKPAIPFLEELADILDVDTETLSNWANKKKEDDSLEHPQFFDTWKKIKNYQKLLLLKRTLGRFNPSGAIFQLKANHGMIETEKTILAGSTNKDEKLVIEFVPEKPLPDDE